MMNGRRERFNVKRLALNLGNWRQNIFVPEAERLSETEKIIYTVSTQAKNCIFFVLKTVAYAKLIFWSGRQDSNLRPPHPQCDALPGCATSRPKCGSTLSHSSKQVLDHVPINVRTSPFSYALTLSAEIVADFSASLNVAICALLK
jgi:hypothetical protein